MLVRKYSAQPDVAQMQMEEEWSTQDAAAWKQYRLTIIRRCAFSLCQHAVRSAVILQSTQAIWKMHSSDQSFEALKGTV